MFPIVYSDEFLRHAVKGAHPESSDRLRAIVSALQESPFHDRLTWLSPTPIEGRSTLQEAIARVHPPAYLEKLRHLAGSGGAWIDGDTYVAPASYDVACLAVNAWLDGVDLAIEHHTPVFVAARPPGHHALPDRGMGFCLLANAAIAAKYALQQPGIDRVAILDWDVHHGNGTEAIVAAEEKIAYCSLHQSPAYPGTGDRHFYGKYDNVCNIPLPPGTSRETYHHYFETVALPFLANWQPSLIIVSAGYDATFSDPLAEMNLVPKDFRQIAYKTLQIQGRMVCGLEGGYDLVALSQSVVETIAAWVSEGNISKG
jgi:acetoin utilization deacetylase AcuC-like enzyme